MTLAERTDSSRTTACSIATGSRAIPVDGARRAELDGVIKLDDLDDARDLIRRSRRAKVGGRRREAASPHSRSWRASAPATCDVHYFMRTDRYWSNVLSESESRIVEEGLRAQRRGDPLLHGARRDPRPRGPRRGRRDRRRRRGSPAIWSPSRSASCPSKELAEAAGLECGRGILVDEHLRSSDEDIFAAGDVAEVRDARRADGGCSRSCGARRSRRAGSPGLNMATEPVHSYDKGARRSTSRGSRASRSRSSGTVGSGKDSDLQGIVARGQRDLAAARRRADRGVADARPRTSGSPWREGIIAGAVVMGDQALSFPLQELIAARADVSAVAPSLLAPGGARRRARRRLLAGLEGAPCLGDTGSSGTRSPRSRRSRRSTLLAYRQAGSLPAASGLVGHGIGVVGFVLMLMTETLYSHPQAARRRPLGQHGRAGCRFHMVTGLVGPYMVLLPHVDARSGGWPGSRCC